jgi:hypothetical protein
MCRGRVEWIVQLGDGSWFKVMLSWPSIFIGLLLFVLSQGFSIVIIQVNLDAEMVA